MHQRAIFQRFGNGRTCIGIMAAVEPDLRSVGQ